MLKGQMLLQKEEQAKHIINTSPTCLKEHRKLMDMQKEMENAGKSNGTRNKTKEKA